MDKKISYQLKRSKKAKHLRIAVYCDGNVVVTAPWVIQKSLVEKFISQKKQWIVEKILYFQKRPVIPFIKLNREVYEKNKKQALSFVASRIQVLNRPYGFSFGNIAVKNQKTRWGSCSRKKNLNFNYKIVFLPAHLQDYILVHELCHLQEMNHSRHFWKLVARSLPNYPDLKKQLQQHAMLLR